MRLGPLSVSLWVPLALAVVLALFPALFPGELYFFGFGFLTFIFITLAVAWNMVGGYAGQVSFGYAAFFGTAAYVTAILWSRCRRGDAATSRASSLSMGTWRKPVRPNR